MARRYGLIVLLLFGFAGAVRGVASGQPGEPLPFDVGARAAVLINYNTGQILYEKNADEKLIPASLTKVLTLYLAFDALNAGQVKLDEDVTISEKAWKMGGSQMFIEVGQRVKFDDLLKGIAIVSGNDACVAVAEAIAGSEAVFVKNMNDKAQALGLVNSHFMNPDGLPAEGHYSTARDMAHLARRYLQDHPEALAYHSTKEYMYGKIKQYNRNGLLFKHDSVDGIKTGWVQESGFHIIATGTQDNERYIAVVMGEKTDKQREEDAWALLLYGFKNFTTVKFATKGEKQGETKVSVGAIDSAPVESAEDGWITVPRAKAKALTITRQILPSVAAPVTKGMKLGTLFLAIDGRRVREAPLVASIDIARGGFFKRLRHSFSQSMFQPPYTGLIITIAAILAMTVFVRLAFFRKRPGFGRN